MRYPQIFRSIKAAQIVMMSAYPAIIQSLKAYGAGNFLAKCSGEVWWLCHFKNAWSLLKLKILSPTQPT